MFITEKSLAHDVAHTHGRDIQCNIGDDIWTSVVPKSRSHQVLCQLLVTGLYVAVVIVSRPGTATILGGEIFVYARLCNVEADKFMSTLE